MPMLDVHIPEGALDPSREAQLLENLTDILLEHEGADPTNERARSLAWVFLNRPTRVLVAGADTELPHYRIIASVPEGQLDSERRTAMVAAVTDAVLRAEPNDRPYDPTRVWVFTHQVPEGTWGWDGQILGLADIVGFVLDDPETGIAYATGVLAG